MTTKPPSSVQEFPATSVERVAYESVEAIPTEEPNDRSRLGYHVWRWLMNKQGTLEQAIAESGSRLKIPAGEALKIISESLQKRGVSVK